MLPLGVDSLIRETTELMKAVRSLVEKLDRLVQKELSK